MKHILLSSIIIIVIATPLGAPAQTPDIETVGGLRARFERLEDPGLLWTTFAVGAMQGVAAAGMACDPAAGASRITVGELAAHLRYTAERTDWLPLAIRKNYVGRGCGSLEWSDGWSLGRKAFAKELLLIRTTEDRAAIEDHVRRADEPGADPAAQVIGLVAGARLLELSRGGLRPTQKSVPTTR